MDSSKESTSNTKNEKESKASSNPINFELNSDNKNSIIPTTTMKEIYNNPASTSNSSSESENESENDNNDDDDSNDQDANGPSSYDNLDMICMSPPTNSRVSKKDKAKHKSNNKKSHKKSFKFKKRPTLVNSASNLTNLDDSSLTDTLTKLQEKQLSNVEAQHESKENNNNNNNNSSSTNLKTQFDHSASKYSLAQSTTASNISDNHNYETSNYSSTISHIQSNSDFKANDNSQTITEKDSRRSSHNDFGLMRDSYANRVSKSIDQQQPTPAPEPTIDIDPFDRTESYKKIIMLLKLALSSNQNKNRDKKVVNSMMSVPPPPPPPSTPSSALIQQQQQQQQNKSRSNVSYFHQHSTPVNFGSSIAHTFSGHIEESTRQLVAENVWKHIYDYFEFYNDRATENEQIDRRLAEARAVIPTTINQILNTNYTAITSNMNSDINSKMKTPCDYANLYQHKLYIDQLCYLYWLVEDVINDVGYIESLYPSSRLLSLNQPAYADHNFEATTKTLLLWYKIMGELMHKCDVLGKFLGFAKKQENLLYWTWFDQRLNYSRMEYENVQNWLNDNFLPKNQSATNTSGNYNNNNNNFNNRSYLNNINSTTTSSLSSPVITLTKPSFENMHLSHQQQQLNQQQVLITNVNHPFKQQSKQNRQVSFELHASRSLANLLYNFDNTSQSHMINCFNTSSGGGGGVGGGIDSADLPYHHINNLLWNNSNVSNCSNNSIYQLTANSLDATGNKKQDQLQSIESSNVFATNFMATTTTSQLANKINIENDHLKTVKLHHLNSYISRSSSNKSNNESPTGSALTSSFYASLVEPKLNASGSTSANNNNNNNESNQSSVGFTLHDSNASDSESQNNNSSSNSSSSSSSKGNSDAECRQLHESTTETTITSNQTLTYDPKNLTQHVQQHRNSESFTDRQKIFAEFLHKKLRKHGLTKTYDEIRKIISDTLPHALQALQIDRCERHSTNGGDDHFYYHLMPLHRKCREYMSQFRSDDEALKYGVRGEWFKKLDLPTFRPLYMYLSNVILELMHMCIKMQIENKGDMKKQLNYKFSLLSIEVLTHECRECIEQAILVRQFYYHMVFSVFDRSEMDVQTALENDLLKFDEDLKEIINIYLSLVTDWVHDLVASPDTSKALWVLQDEWQFCKNNLYFVTASEDIYAKRFCTMCCSVNGSLIHSLSDIDNKHKQPLMEYLANMEMYQDMSSLEMDSYDNETQESNDNQGNETSEHVVTTFHNPDDSDDEYENDSNFNQKNAYKELESFDVNLKCNEFKEEINQLRKRCMKALGFCADLIGDLELAAKYNVRSPIQDFLNELKASNHVLVQFTNPELQSSYQTTPNSSTSSFEPGTPSSDTTSVETKCSHHQQPMLSFMIFVPYDFSKDKSHIVRLLFIISAKDDYEHHLLNNNDSNQNNENNKDIKANSNVNDLYDPNKNNAINVRRLSSSNSFLDMNKDHQKSILSKLSKMANLDTNMSKICASGSTSPIPPSAESNTGHLASNAFIFSPQTSSDGYLLFLQLPKHANNNENWKWTGNSIKLYANMPVRRSLYQHKNICDPSSPIGLILVVPRPSILKEKRVELKTKLKGTITLIREKTSFHPNIEYAIDDLKESILSLRKEAFECIKLIEKDLKTTVHYDNESKYHIHPVIDQRYLSEIWRVSYNFGIELQNECIKFMTQDRGEQFAKGLAEFCIMWCEYIVDKTERGKGRTVQPWAAKKGIQLMQEACLHSSYLNDSEFLRLKNAVEKCILHVVGGRNNSNKIQVSDKTIKPCHSTLNTRVQEHSIEAAHRYSESQLYESTKEISLTRSSTQSSTIFRKINRELPPNQRFEQGCLQADRKREDELLEKRFIGKILDQQRTHYVITATEVKFNWQLGLLIGEGQYGKVYSCVNLDTGEPMAMKEIRFRSNDVETIKGIADEINNLKGIEHENLVKFYGAELHRKEILIFMEFCGDQCTLDRISRDASGLPEKIVRDYTKSLLKAVETLHENNIMHRDIKGANIFLKAMDPKHPEKVVLKLGDFGCSIKFKDPIGPNRAKATGFIGTFAFMAPEVMISGGAVDVKYSYPADIWSVGCVVIEMFTGKRPWHPLNQENILYKVHIEGKQKKPPYPASDISGEAIDFLDRCLAFEQNDRYSADQLLDHPFVKVSNDETYISL